MLDEVVYQREVLRRALLRAVEKLETAAENYDPADDLLMQDAVCVLCVAALQTPVEAYGNAVVDRIEQRAGRTRSEENK
jgi:hypothetical protein